MPKDIRGEKNNAREREAEKEWVADKQTMAEKRPKEMSREAEAHRGKRQRYLRKESKPEKKNFPFLVVKWEMYVLHVWRHTYGLYGYKNIALVCAKLGKRNLSLSLSLFFSPSLSYSFLEGRAESALYILKRLCSARICNKDVLNQS